MAKYPIGLSVLYYLSVGFMDVYSLFVGSVYLLKKNKNKKKT